MNGWPLQLLSVACLSLAAKMEEPLVPSLLDIQVFHLFFHRFFLANFGYLQINNSWFLGWKCKIHFWAKKYPKNGASGAKSLGLETSINFSILLFKLFCGQNWPDCDIYRLPCIKGKRNHSFYNARYSIIKIFIINYLKFWLSIHIYYYLIYINKYVWIWCMRAHMYIKCVAHINYF